MHALRLGQRLAIAVALSLTLLIVGAVELGLGIQQGDVALPDLDVHVSGLHIVASTTGLQECGLALHCPRPSRDYYVVWVFYKTAPDNVRETGRRILVVPLRR